MLNTIAAQILWALKFMHDNSYAHADIKGMNILLDKKPTSGNKFNAYLVDFGLVAKTDNIVYKPEPKAAGDGTVRF